MKKIDEEGIKKSLQSLRPVTTRPTQKAMQTRRRYLAEAQELAVSKMPQRRLNGWTKFWQTLFLRKENSPMFNFIVSVIVIASILLGGSGVGVAAAQSSQPGELLYPIKTWSEDVYTNILFGDQARFEYALNLADRRIQEMQTMFEAGEVPEEALQLRLTEHIRTALELAVRRIENAEPLLEQIRLRLEEQLRLMLEVHSGGTPQGEVVQNQVRDMLNTRIGWVDEALGQLAQLKTQIQNQQQMQTNQGQGGSGQQQGSGDGFGGWNPPWMTPTPEETLMPGQHGKHSQGGSGYGN